MESRRQSKVSRLLQRELGEIFQRSSYSGAMVTITMVRISPDLSFAKVYLSIFPENLKEKAFERIQSNGWEIRKKLGMRVRNQLRIVPELVFFIDDSFEYSERIDELLNS
ncbi:MAG: ribosome-binding factor A [Flavobacteriales bacterium]|nr:MAG: ribosome-binding factor A [Flavobacteriales bacterium]